MTAKNEKGETEEKQQVPDTEIADLEPVVKSPPEPTRVKSPEQIIMRSPDPVNWTVPLDTGKTFTVTQNVREGLSHFMINLLGIYHGFSFNLR